jgi:hypothetical protein
LFGILAMRKRGLSGALSLALLHQTHAEVDGSTTKSQEFGYEKADFKQARRSHWHRHIKNARKRTVLPTSTKVSATGQRCSSSALSLAEVASELVLPAAMLYQNHRGAGEIPFRDMGDDTSLFAGLGGSACRGFFFHFCCVVKRGFWVLHFGSTKSFVFLRTICRKGEPVVCHIRGTSSAQTVLVSTYLGHDYIRRLQLN